MMICPRALCEAAATMPARDMVGSRRDMFIIEAFTDTNGRTVFIVYGFGWKGTFAGRLYFKNRIYPNITTFTDAWYVFEWVDGDTTVSCNSTRSTRTRSTTAHEHYVAAAATGQVQITARSRSTNASSSSDSRVP